MRADGSLYDHRGVHSGEDPHVLKRPRDSRARDLVRGPAGNFALAVADRAAIGGQAERRGLLARESSMIRSRIGLRFTSTIHGHGEESAQWE